MKIAFQGKRGAYSEEAIRHHFKGPSVKPIGHELSEEVILSLIEHQVDMAVLPVENSIVGNVSVNLDLLYHYPVYVIGEIYLPIHHHLMAIPGTKLSDLSKVYSHPIALAQCRPFLENNKIRSIAEYDTAGACHLVKERALKNEAAIGSKLCAQEYGLEILSNDIQINSRNITRFFIVVREKDIPQDLTSSKTSIVFSAKDKPGALLDCLEIFKKYAINLTKIESRPIVENPFEYVFFVDFQNGQQEEKTIRCLEELKRDTHHVKVLGSYSEGIIPKV